MSKDKIIKVLVCKPGLDGHDRGAKVLARALRDAGMEVIYTGIHQTPDDIVNTVIQEDPDAVMLSILSGSHNALCPIIIQKIKEKFADYDSANAWLSQANAKDSNGGYTTDWTSRWTGTVIPEDYYDLQYLSIRVEANNIALWKHVKEATNLIQISRGAVFTFTPAYLFLFVEGNLALYKEGVFDFTGRM